MPYLAATTEFLGYHFNPASFWYVCNADRDMVAMILEVNNTFGERRIYFLHPDKPPAKVRDGIRVEVM